MEHAVERLGARFRRGLLHLADTQNVFLVHPVGYAK